RIKAQGGLVLIPHPFDSHFRPSAIERSALESIVKDIDIIEVFNSHTVFPGDSAKAYRFAKKHRLLGSAGSDAHTVVEIGSSYIEMPEFAGAEGFKKSLMKATINGHIANPFHRLVSVMRKASKKIRKRLCIG
ncbi:MAG: PHP domain-containing protein, partial [Chloroflexi bacterium]|nr:PHP domain-containing protein [Chloroflexota bacterium]